MIKLPAWSWSSYSDYLNCPLQYKLTRVTKAVVRPESEHLAWGNKVHSALELRVKDGTPLPPGMEKWEKYAKWATNLSSLTPVTERKVALDENLKPVEFWDKKAWCRGVLDLTILADTLAVVLDWKTGKVRADSDQLKLFAGFIFSLHPEIQTVRTGYVWLNHDKVTEQTYQRFHVEQIWDTFKPGLERMKRSHGSGYFPPRPSELCSWCPVGRDHCKYSRKG